MKNFISLFIIALIFLSSCKSNSFMTQRYTKFGHAHKHSTAVAKVQKETKAPATQAVTSESSPQEVQSFAVVPSAPAVKDNAVESHRTPVSPKTIINPLLRAGNTAVTLIKAELKKSESQNLGTKKTVKEKMHRAAGLFDTLFKIVLFAIILAILVAIIILIILT